jgi:hypothetical protein
MAKAKLAAMLARKRGGSKPWEKAGAMILPVGSIRWERC